MEVSQTELRGETAPWGSAARLALAACVLLGLYFRLRGLSAEGFGEVRDGQKSKDFSVLSGKAAE